MAQPGTDRVDVHARTQKMRGSSVTDRYPDSRALSSMTAFAQTLSRIAFGHRVNPEACERSSTSIEENALRGRAPFHKGPSSLTVCGHLGQRRRLLPLPWIFTDDWYRSGVCDKSRSEILSGWLRLHAHQCYREIRSLNSPAGLERWRDLALSTSIHLTFFKVGDYRFRGSLESDGSNLSTPFDVLGTMQRHKPGQRD